MSQYARRIDVSMLKETVQKEQNVLSVLLDGQNHKGYREAVKEIILLSIDQLIQDNKQLCEKHKKSFGSLNDYLVQAAQDIIDGKRKELSNQEKQTNITESSHSSQNLIQNEPKENNDSKNQDKKEEESSTTEVSTNLSV